MRTHYLSGWIIGFSIGLGGCRIVPIQMTQITLNERFKQDFFDRSPAISEAEMNTTLNLMLGAKNYTNLLQSADASKIAQLKNQECETRGGATIGISLVPGTVYSAKNFCFTVSGIGNYSIVLKKDNLVYYTSTFQVIEDLHTAAELEGSVVKVRFRQQLINHFSSHSVDFVTDAELTAVLHVKKLRSNVYSLNYAVPHEIIIEDKFAGNLRFVPPSFPEAKPIDLRGLRFVRNRYVSQKPEKPSKNAQ